MDRVTDCELLNRLRGKLVAVPPSFWPGGDPCVWWFMRLEKIVARPSAKGSFFLCRLQDQDARLEDSICELKRRDVNLAIAYNNSLFPGPACDSGERARARSVAGARCGRVAGHPLGEPGL